MANTNRLGTFLVIIVLACGVSAQQPAPPQNSGKQGASSSGGAGTGVSPQKVVLKVGAAQVTQSEIETVVSRLDPRAKVIVAREGLRPVEDEYVKTLVLSQRAVADQLDSSPALRFELELQREQTLAQAEYQKMAAEIRISPQEVSQYFDAHRSEFETVQVREFLIRKRPAGSKDPRQGLPMEEARAKAEAIRKALLTGRDIDKVAEDLSDPPVILLADPKVRNLRRTEMVPILSKASFDLKAGGVTEPVDTAQAFIVVKVFGHHHPELKEVSAEIEGRLRKQKLDAEIDSLKTKAGVWMDAGYFSGHPAPVPAGETAPGASAPSAPNP